MNQLIFIGVLGAAAATGFVLRYRGMHWFVAWLVASMVTPAILYVGELVQPTGWLGVAVVFGGVYGSALGGAGVLAGWFVARKASWRRSWGQPDKSLAYRSAIALALVAAFLLVWLSLGVGIIGKDGDPANLMYFGVLAIGVAGAIIARFRPVGMARALFGTAVAQALVAAIALIAGLGLPYSGPAEIVLLNGFFIAMFGGAAWLFRRAALARPERVGT